MEPIKPLKSVVAWVGGKRRLAPTIVARLDDIPHTLYVEPFIGMGSIFLARPRKAKFEVLNDRSKDVVNLFRVAKHHPRALVEELRFSLTARAEFERLLLVPPDTLTDIQRAARFFVIQRLTYGGRPTARSFPARGNAGKGFHQDRLMQTFSDLQARLAGVVIENLDWTELLERYDRPDALFYLDPPYYGCEDYYGKGLFSREDHARLADILLSLAGHWILSINNVPEIRALYEGRARIDEVKTSWSVSGSVQPVTELLIAKT